MPSFRLLSIRQTLNLLQDCEATAGQAETTSACYVRAHFEHEQLSNVYTSRKTLNHGNF